LLSGRAAEYTDATRQNREMAWDRNATLVWRSDAVVRAACTVPHH
jgi:hypothetical protein